MPDTTHTTDLEATISSATPAVRVRAAYAEGSDIVKTYGSPALLSIALVNAEASRLPSAEKDAVLNQVALIGHGWLTSRSLLVPGTTMQVHLMKEIDLLLVSTTWSVGGHSWWIADDGSLTETRPPMREDAGVQLFSDASFSSSAISA